MGLTPEEQKECAKHLKRSVLLKSCTDEQLIQICQFAKKKNYTKGHLLQKEGDNQERMVVLAQGSVVREKIGANGEVHQIETHMGGYTVGSLHVMNKDPAYATTKCSSDAVTYEIGSDTLNSYFKSNPEFAFNVVYSLTKEIRNYTRSQRTPLFEQQGDRPPILAVSTAAGIESFYRAALNAFLNQHLTGVKMGSLFPNMHIQIPTRIAYINGFKGLRYYLDEQFRKQRQVGEEHSTSLRLLAAITPGVIMTPVSSILEACNAGHSNPEALWRRSTRGYIPRTGREVIFGVGLNQLSDYCEERVPQVIESPAFRNAFGSLSAGVMSGYLSHVVHNMSTLKLMNPNKSYSQHMKEYIKRSETRIPAGVPDSMKPAATTATALLLPTGVMIRTTQIVGSFIILNGTIKAINRYFYQNTNQK